jgi:hypothetical protein
MRAQSEQELAKHFISHFADQDLYFEVPAAGIIDIVMKSGQVITAIEVKTSFNFGVLEQAIKNKGYAHYSYIAVPSARKRWFQEQVCKDYGVGLLECEHSQWDDRWIVREIIAPRLNRRVVKIKLQEYHKESVAGSQHERMTSFKHFVRQLQQTVSRYPQGVAFQDVFKMGITHYSSMSSFKSCLAKYIAQGIITGLRVENGMIYPNKVK